MEKEDIIGLMDELLEYCRILKANGVDLTKIQLSRIVHGETRRYYYFLLRDINQDGIDIEKIIEENNLDPEYKIGRRIEKLRRYYKEHQLIIRQRKEAERLEIAYSPIESTIHQVARYLKILKDNGVDFRFLDMSVKGRKILLKDIKQIGIDINKIIRENNLDPNFPIGAKILYLRDKYSEKDFFSEEDKRAIEEMGLMRETPTTELLEYCKVLKENGFDFSNLKLSEFVDGKVKFYLLKEVNQEGLDLNKIIEENRLDPNFPLCRKISSLRAIYNGVAKGYISKEEETKIKELGILSPKVAKGKQSVKVDEAFRYIEILNENGFDFSICKLQTSKGEKSRYYTLGELHQEGVDINRIIEEYNLDPDFPICSSVNYIRALYSGSKRRNLTEEEKRKVEDLRILKRNISKKYIGKGGFGTPVDTCDKLDQELGRLVEEEKNKELRGDN